MKLPSLRALLMPGLVLALCGLCLFAVLPGCQTDAQTGAITLGGVPLPTTQQVQTGRDQAVAALQATTQAVQDVKDQLQALPANDPVRKSLQSKLDQLQQLEPKLQQAIDLFDAANRTIQSGHVDPSLGAAATAMLGVYGGLAVSLASFGFGIYQRIEAGKKTAIATQAVKTSQVIIDAAGGMKPEVVAQVNTIQDEATRKFVDEVQATLPEPPDPRPAILPSPAN